MKKLTFIMLLLVATVSALAQPEPGTWTITPRVGVNSSDVSGVKMYYADPFAASYDSDAYVNSKRKWGFIAGVEVEYQIQRPLAVSLGVFYSDEGFRAEHDEYKDDTHYTSQPGCKLKWNLRYLNVPLLAHFYVEPSLLPGLALKAGVQFGFLVKNNYEQEYFNDSHTKISGSNSRDGLRFAISIPAVISYSYRNIVADLRYNIGVSNIKEDVLEDGSCRSNSIQFTIGYQFRL